MCVHERTLVCNSASVRLPSGCMHAAKGTYLTSVVIGPAVSKGYLTSVVIGPAVINTHQIDS